MSRKRDWMIPGSLFLLGLLPILTGSISLLAIQDAISTGSAAPDIENYANHPFPIVTHIIFGSLFNLLGPFQFVPAIRRRWPKLHKTTGRLFVISGVLTAIGAIWMNQFFPHFGGILKYTSNLFFGVVLIAALMIAIRAILRREISVHRVWMIRAYAIGLGVSTQRLILLPYFIVYGIPEGNILGALLWAAWFINIGIAEWWIRRTNMMPVAYGLAS